MKIDGNQSAQEKAWAIASDPSASEKQWLAACTLLEGKQPALARTNRKLPQSVGLPWSVCVSGVSGLGAFMMFGFLSAAVCEAAAVLTGAFYTFNGPHAFALLSAAFIAFSSIFTYQQHIWGGGRMWSHLHYGLVTCGALLPFSLEFFVSTPSSLGNLILFALWGVGFTGLSALSARMTRNSIKTLDRSVGADRVMPHSRLIFASSGAALLGLTLLPFMFTVFSSMWLWLPVLLVGSGFCIASANRASNPQTAATFALAAWNPLILANLVLLSALVANSVLAVFLPYLQLTIADYAVGIGTMLCITLGPLMGARIASSALKRSLELELHRAPSGIIALTGANEPMHRITDESTACEPT